MANVVEFKWVDTAQYVYQEYLSKEYSCPSCKDDWEYIDLIAHKKIPRPNHGLAHTLRSAAFVPQVVDAYNAFNGAKITHIQAENMQLALLFFVAGRENDVSKKDDPTNYDRFRKKSAMLFEGYVKEQLPNRFTAERFRHYKMAIQNPNEKEDPEYQIIRICHNLDLARCTSEEKYTSVKEYISKYVGKTSTEKLAQCAIDCLSATGDRIYLSSIAKDYKGLLFIACSENVCLCLDKINRVICQYFSQLSLNSLYISNVPPQPPSQLPVKAQSKPSSVPIEPVPSRTRTSPHQLMNKPPHPPMKVNPLPVPTVPTPSKMRAAPHTELMNKPPHPPMKAQLNPSSLPTAPVPSRTRTSMYERYQGKPL